MFAILLTFVAVVLTWWYWNLSKWNKYLGRYPGPPLLPIIGCVHIFPNDPGFISVVSKLIHQYGGIVKVFFGASPTLMVADKKLAEFILGSQVHIEKGYEYDFLHKWLGTGLLTSTGSKWKRQRKLITPTFHFQILERFVDVFNSQGRNFVENLRKEIPNKLDVFPYAARYALDVICETAMGTCVNAQSDVESAYVNSVGGMGEISVRRVFSIHKKWDFLYRFTEDYKMEKKYLEILHGYTNSVIQSRTKELVDSDVQPKANEDSFGIKKKIAFLDLLLQARIDGEPLPDENIREEVDTFMFEGHDTTATAISFTLYCLSIHPEVQEKIVEESKEIFHDDLLRDPTLQELQNMKYLEMVIKESMRLYPPVPLISRQLREDAEFDGGVLPKGLTLTFVIFEMHRQEEFFPEPLKFDPERFSSENTQGRPPFIYVPFSAGPRNCIGQRFALLELKSIISKIVRHFEILPVPEQQPIVTAESVLKSENGVVLRFKERNYK